jgi:ABC-type transporter Mla maintaining outer membrane lipid asymmetry permease subunit MlaE
MVLSVCHRLLAAFCIIGALVLFGKVTGMFAAESFAENCSGQHQNSFDTVKNNITCPLGIELNPFNFIDLHK